MIEVKAKLPDGIVLTNAPMMHMEFDIPVPETCAECRLGYVMSRKGYQGWIIHCLANPSIDISAGDGINKRDERCPGIIMEDENVK